MTSLITTILGIFLGIWVNNIFVWIIKDRVDAIDSLIKNATQIKELVFNFFKEKQHQPDQEFDLTLFTLYIGNLTSYSIIIENEILDNLIVEVADYIVNNLNDERNNKTDLEKRTQIEDFNRKVDTLFAQAHIYRKEITSFCYMIKQFNPCKLQSKYRVGVKKHNL